MENLRYHSVIPTNDRPGTFNAAEQITAGGFGDSDLIDFEFDVPGRSLVRNSLEISADVTFLNGGTPIGADAGEVSLDHNAGAHALFETFSTSSVQQGNLENIGTAYPRFAAVMLAGENNRVDIPNLSKQLEWRMPSDEIAGNFCRVRTADGNGVSQSERQRFNLKPRIMINRTSGDIPFSKTGRMRISTNLTSPNRLFRNQLDAAGANGFRLANVRLNFRTVPEVKSSEPLTAMKVVALKTTISSALANVSVNIPSPAATGITLCFQNAANENSASANCNALEYINVSSIQYLFNSANSYISYKLDNKSEMLRRAVASFTADDGAGKKYQTSPEDLAAGRNFFLGSDLDGVMDLRSNTFDIQVQSDIAGTTHNMFIYAHTLAAL